MKRMALFPCLRRVGNVGDDSGGEREGASCCYLWRMLGEELCTAGAAGVMYA